MTPKDIRESNARRALFDSYEQALVTGWDKPYDIMLHMLSSLESKGYRITRIPGRRERNTK